MLSFAQPEQHENISLPVKFRSVLYLDVFGWLDKNPSEQQGSQRGVMAASFNDNQRQGGEQNHALTAVTEEGGDEFAVRMMSNGRMGSVHDTLRSQAGRNLPPSMRISLGRACKKLRAEIDRELSFWEDDKAEALLIEAPQGKEALDALKGLRTEFNEVDSDFQGSDPEAGQAYQLTDTSVIWLSLEWEVSGNLWQYFYNTTTQETVWNNPPQQDHLSDINGLRVRIGTYREQVQALAEAPPDIVQSSNAASLEQPRLPEPSPAQVPDSHRPLVEREASFEDAEPAQPQPEQAQFGGREAVQVQPGSEYQRNFFAVNSTAGAGFHPHRSNVADKLETTVKRPPGQMPWRIFFQASLLVIVMWVVGFCWVLIEVVFEQKIPGFDVRSEPEEPHHHDESEDNMLINPQLFFAGQWPHRFFNPVGLACHSSFGSSLLIAEKHSVHELTFTNSGVMLRPALKTCLGEALDFQAGGIQGISLDCNVEAEDCFALLFGADGQSLLNCSLATSHVVSHGRTYGNWHGRAAGDGVMWALSDDAIVRLDPRPGAEHERVPSSHVPHKYGSSIKMLQLLNDRVILGLDPKGQLVSWPLQAGSSQLWQLPTTERWSSLCGTRDTLFLTSASGDGKLAGVWQAPLSSILQQ